MDKKITIKKMNNEMYHHFFKEYQNDEDLYLNKNDFFEYVYSEEKVNAYILKQSKLKRICFAIMCDDEIVGELKIYNIIPFKSAFLGISMKNKNYKDKGYGTKAELLAIDYVFNKLEIPVLYADSIITNTRSQHVLEKVGFKLYFQDKERKHYKITK